MATVIGLIVLILGVAMSIGLHELGHMIPAKLFGVRVSQYFIGFGPTLWSRQKGETEYGIKAIPLGGFVRIVGMFPPAEVVGAKRGRGRIADLIWDTREASAEEIPDGEDHRAFYRLSVPKKLVVMAGGTFMNFALAAILLVVIFTGIGAQTPSTTIGSVSSCIPSVDVAGQCQNTSEPPALAAGLQPGDRIVSYGGQPIQTWSDLQREIVAHPGAVSVVVEREGEEQTFVLQPFLADRVVVDSYGEPVLDSNGEMVVEQVPYLGVTPRFELQRQPVSTAFSYLWEGTVATVQAVLRIPVLMVDLVNGLISNEPRDPAGLVSIIGVGQLAVEIAASDDLGLHLATRVASMLSLLASLNLALFVFNLLPLLPMDGGHVAAALWEGIKKIRARLTGAVFRPADTARLTPLTYLMTLLLISMAVLLIVTDLLKPLSMGL